MARLWGPAEDVTSAKLLTTASLPASLGGDRRARLDSTSWTTIRDATRVQLGASGDTDPPAASVGVVCNAIVHSGAAEVRLYNQTDSTVVAGSTLTLGGSQLNAMEGITIEADKVYVLQYRMTSAGEVSIWDVQIRQSLT